MPLDRFARIARYLIAGASAALVDFGVFSLCLKLLPTLPIVGGQGNLSVTTLANAAGILTGFLWAFCLQKFWAFRSRGSALPQMLATAILLGLNIFVTSLAIPWLSSTFGIGLSLAKIVMQGIVVTWNYLILHKLVFRTVRSGDEA